MYIQRQSIIHVVVTPDHPSGSNSTPSLIEMQQCLISRAIVTLRQLVHPVQCPLHATHVNASELLSKSNLLYQPLSLLLPSKIPFNLNLLPTHIL